MKRSMRQETKKLEARLLPCPFCGFKAGFSVIHGVLPTGERDTLYQVQCLARDCQARTNWRFPAEAALHRWNQRHNGVGDKDD